MKLKVVVLCVALAVLAGAVSYAVDAPLPKMQTISGQVLTVSATEISIQNEKQGQLTFAINGDTQIRQNDRPAGLDGIKPGIRVGIAYLQDANGRLAKIIVILPPPSAPTSQMTVVGGQVTGKTDSSITIRNERSESLTFVVNPETRILLGDKQVGFGDVAIGAPVKVGFVVATGGAKLAKGIQVQLPPPPPIQKIAGRVADKGDSGFAVVNERGETIAFNVNGDTKVYAGDKQVGYGDLKVGARVQVGFLVASDNSKLAKGVLILPPPPPPPAKMLNIEGTVTEVTSTGISVQTERQGVMTFVVNGDTQFRLREKPASFADVKVGGRVLVAFLPTNTPPLVAKGILIVVPKVSGHIGEITTAGFTLITSPDKVWNIILTDGTKVVSHGYIGTFADLKPKYGATVEGLIDGTNVRAIAMSLELPSVRGIVQSVSGSQIIIKPERRDAIAVNIGGPTIITLLKPKPDGPTRIGIGDVQPGMALSAGGHPAGERTLNALWVEVGIPPTPAAITR